jgi:hypothetical protein
MAERLRVVQESHGLCEGPILIYRCTLTNALFCSCHECEVTWDHPGDIESGKATAFEVRCADGCFTVPSDKEIASAGWSHFILRFKDEEPL